MTVLPKSLVKELAAQIEEARAVWQRDRDAKLAGVHIDPPPGRPLRAAASPPSVSAPVVPSMS